MTSSHTGESPLLQVRSTEPSRLYLQSNGPGPVRFRVWSWDHRRGPAGSPGGLGPELYLPSVGASGSAEHSEGGADSLSRVPGLPAGRLVPDQRAGRPALRRQVPGVQRPEGAGLLPDLSREVWRRLPGLSRSVSLDGFYFHSLKC